MLSFIIIGKNEGWKLTKCLESVYSFIKINSIVDYEVIYVDSKSSDDSIERAKAFRDVLIFQITGECNAAIGRNIGAKESKGDILFFIDGDMEIKVDFYKVAFDDNLNLMYPFVSGGLINCNYNSNWNLLYVSEYHRNKKKDKFENDTGGVFIIKRELWEQVGGMKTKFKRNEDLDLGMRLSKLGYPVLRKKEIIACHHTIPYSDKKRAWKLLFDTSELYPMVLFRDHITSAVAWRRVFSENYTLLLLILVGIIIILTNILSLFGLYFISLLFKAYRNEIKISLNLLLNILKFFLRDIVRFFAFFFFFPRSHPIHYRRI